MADDAIFVAGAPLPRLLTVSPRDGFAVAWDQDGLDMASTTIADLAEPGMPPAARP